MSSAAWELQRSIFAKLDGDATLTALVTGVFNRVPQGQAFPYIKIGHRTIRNWSTFGTLGEEPTITLHIWSRYRGNKEAEDIMSRMDTLLNRATLSVTGQNFVSIEREFSDVLEEQDGVTYHGIQRYRILLHE